MRFGHLPGLLTVALLALACHDFTGPDPETTTGPLLSHAGTGSGLHGAGSIGSGAATPGGSRQDFEFDVASNLTGTLSYRDWAVVRSDGSVATVTVSAADPGTGITAFRDGSAVCADPSRAAEFDGVGRLDTGELVSFTIVGCDNGADGSGADRFRMSVPSFGYQTEGFLSSGDIVKTGTAPPPGTTTQVRGLGAIGTGTATPGSNRQEFDFDVSATPTGRLAYTDYAVIRGDGSVGRFSVDAEADPATGMTSYQQVSSTCVRFGGTGRIDTGELWSFVIDACDNTSPGAGFDTFAIDLPGRGYGARGTLTSGDIALGAAEPSTGDLAVNTTTTGESLDPDGYTVAVDETNSQPIPINGRVTFADLSAGSHSVTLSGVASNCTVSGGNTQTVTVSSDEVSATTFSVSCTALAGSLTATASTSGENLDADGYTVTVDETSSQAIPINGSVTFTGLSAGDHSVALSGVAGNCTVSGENPRTVTVTPGGTATTTFSVSCTPLPGNLTVNIGTSGVSLDLDGYTLTVDGTHARSVAINDSETYTGLPAGNHTVALSGVAANCSVSGGSSRTVAVPAGGTITASFSVTCVPGPAVRLVFTGQPSNTKVNATIQPAVQVTALDAQGNRATSFTGSVTIAIGRNGGGLLPGTLSGTKTVNAASGVATFSDLEIDRAGDYTLRVTSGGLTGAESWVFQIQNLVCVLGVCL